MIFVVTMASSFHPTAASAPLSDTLSVLKIQHTIKLQPLPTYKREMDHKVIEA